MELLNLPLPLQLLLQVMETIKTMQKIVKQKVEIAILLKINKHTMHNIMVDNSQPKSNKKLIINGINNIMANNSNHMDLTMLLNSNQKNKKM